MAYCHSGIDSDVVNALIMAGTMWKCSGMAVQVSVTVLLQLQAQIVCIVNLFTDRPFSLLKTKRICVIEGL
jgi:hypothetical protein